ncbi:MAG: hypothetical protein WDN04_14190 [Rhodospirillales bacterium]
MGHRYRLGHPLAQHILDHAAGRKLSGAHITCQLWRAWKQTAINIHAFVGCSGVLAVRKLSISGADAQDHILISAMTEDGRTIDTATAHRLFELPVGAITKGTATQATSMQHNLETQQAAILEARWHCVNPPGSIKR